MKKNSSILKCDQHGCIIHNIQISFCNSDLFLGLFMDFILIELYVKNM